MGEEQASGMDETGPDEATGSKLLGGQKKAFSIMTGLGASEGPKTRQQQGIGDISTSNPPPGTSMGTLCNSPAQAPSTGQDQQLMSAMNCSILMQPQLPSMRQQPLLPFLGMSSDTMWCSNSGVTPIQLPELTAIDETRLISQVSSPTTSSGGSINRRAAAQMELAPAGMMSPCGTQMFKTEVLHKEKTARLCLSKPSHQFQTQAFRGCSCGCCRLRECLLLAAQTERTVQNLLSLVV